MHGSYIISSNSEVEANNLCEIKLKTIRLPLDKKNPDVLVIECPDGKTSIGISESKEVAKFLSQRPFIAEQRAVVIKRAHTLTIPAQNALLKTLEEPPSYAVIFLITTKISGLLATVLSRCQVLNAVAQNTTAGSKYSYGDIVKTTIGDRFVIAEELAKYEKQDLIELLNNWLHEIHTNIKKGDSTAHTVKDADVILRARNDLEATNINSKLAIENMLLNIKI